MSLWVKTNRFVKRIFPKYIWEIPNNDKKVYLTFDDGPIPEITEWTLAQLKKHNAKATFFCIGDNIEKHPEVFHKVIEHGHAIGNHTFNHLKGWENSLEIYCQNVELCENEIEERRMQNAEENLPSEICRLKSKLFRPPYGKIKPSQAGALRKLGYKIIMWDIISMDFDQTITPEECLNNVMKNIESGSIIVFHDSVKAWKNLEYVLPKTLAFLNEKGYVCVKID